MKPEIHVNGNIYGVPVGDYIITQATVNYGIGSEEMYCDISMRPVVDKRCSIKNFVQIDPIRQRIKEDIEHMYFNPHHIDYTKAIISTMDAKVFSSSMQKLDMTAFDIENIYVNEEKGTIVVKWGDGVTTKVKLEKGDAFDLEAGVSFALLKRLLISHHHLQRVIKDKVIYSGKEEPNVRRTKSRGSDK